MRKGGAGTLIISGSVGPTVIESGVIAGDGSLASLEVDSLAQVSPGVGVGTLSVNGNTTLGGTLVIEVAGNQSDFLNLPESRSLILGRQSRLLIEAVESLPRIGYHDLSVASAGFISRRFSFVPAIGQHLGHGIFAGSKSGARTPVTYNLRSVEITLFQAVAGDSNGDGQFGQRDILQVLQMGKYNTEAEADWTEGDWTGDGYFDQLDIVAALQADRYLQGRYAVRIEARIG